VRLICFFESHARVARALHRSIETLERMKFVFNVAALIALSIEATDPARTDVATRAQRGIQSR
jgi:hypothetical protein